MIRGSDDIWGKMHGNACIRVFLADRFLVEFEQLYAELASRPSWRRGWLGGLRFPSCCGRFLLPVYLGRPMTGRAWSIGRGLVPVRSCRAALEVFSKSAAAGVHSVTMAATLNPAIRGDKHCRIHGTPKLEKVQDEGESGGHQGKGYQPGA